MSASEALEILRSWTPDVLLLDIVAVFGLCDQVIPEEQRFSNALQMLPTFKCPEKKPKARPAARDERKTAGE